ncbi:uncharacterized protein LOC132302370 [Cornus florida]|uniref:uncharacterized protein LOC132302370 n=1 Tax=Cornus florida TaxID=4283 RepID=UPI0028988F6F|nr:uncharacterized protein LOC132302370 [Cornus florida]
MQCYIDLRYIVPPLMNLLFFLLRQPYSSKSSHCFSLIVLAILILIFLLTSIKLPLTITVATDAIRLRAGDFSAAVVLQSFPTVNAIVFTQEQAAPPVEIEFFDIAGYHMQEQPSFGSDYSCD